MINTMFWRTISEIRNIRKLLELQISRINVYRFDQIGEGYLFKFVVGCSSRGQKTRPKKNKLKEG